MASLLVCGQLVWPAGGSSGISMRDQIWVDTVTVYLLEYYSLLSYTFEMNDLKLKLEEELPKNFVEGMAIIAILLHSTDHN